MRHVALFKICLGLPTFLSIVHCSQLSHVLRSGCNVTWDCLLAGFESRSGPKQLFEVSVQMDLTSRVVYRGGGYSRLALVYIF